MSVPTLLIVSDHPPHIGTLREKPLHASLKQWYARPGDRLEVAVGDFVIDLVRDDLLVEIQTKGFSSFKKKVATLLELGRRVRILHPIPIDKWIVKIDREGAELSRRLSPKHGRPSDVFSELVSIPDLLSHSHLEIEVLLIIEEEHRVHTPGQAWRRHGWTIAERRLTEVVGSLFIGERDDLTRLVPEGLPETFTTADLAEALKRPRRAAQQMAYCLRKVGVFVAIGKTGNNVEYRLG